MTPQHSSKRPVPLAHQRARLSSRGTAAVHLSRFEDAWAELTHEDRAWFARWLTELLVDACLEAPAR